MIIWINVVVWLFIHLLGTYIPSKFSLAFIKSIQWFPPIQSWEVKWHNKLRIKKWKEKVPDAADWFFGGIKKRDICMKSKKGMQRFILESKRAELSHYLQILPAPIFFTFNDFYSGWFMILYAFCFHTPFIFIQRYNRYRLESILSRKWVKVL
ncbi:glycosyl-4,4'-diaponeurosporenoate acyltransferase [Bacillus sp. DJP31]|uniref:glycosyl-4,4'-diaponeurosporenoate acyltransferase CrtO family protein n=1 Tax=Bacillus sp. DJP31 TaxID=3409789 RepID=UPI003BB73AD2